MRIILPPERIIRDYFFRFGVFDQSLESGAPPHGLGRLHRLWMQQWVDQREHKISMPSLSEPWGVLYLRSLFAVIRLGRIWVLVALRCGLECANVLLMTISWFEIRSVEGGERCWWLGCRGVVIMVLNYLPASFRCPDGVAPHISQLVRMKFWCLH